MCKLLLLSTLGIRAFRQEKNIHYVYYFIVNYSSNRGILLDVI